MEVERARILSRLVECISAPPLDVDAVRTLLVEATQAGVPTDASEFVNAERALQSAVQLRGQANPN